RDRGAKSLTGSYGALYRSGRIHSTAPCTVTVYPSGGDLAAVSAASRLAFRLSMMTGWPSEAASAGKIRRDEKSPPPPTAPVMMRTGLLGKFCPYAVPTTSASEPSAAAPKYKRGICPLDRLSILWIYFIGFTRSFYVRPR